MMGVRPVAAEGGNGFEGIALISRFQIEFQQEIPQLFFRMVLPQNADDPGHDSVIVPGSGPHLLLLGGGLDGPDPVDDGRGIDALAVHQLLEPKQKPSRPVFIHSQRLFCGKVFRHNGRAVLGVVIIDDGCSQVPGLAEQVVDEEPVVSAGFQQQHQHPLSRLYPLAGQVEDHRRIGDDKLMDVLRIHGRKNILQLDFVHRMTFFGNDNLSSPLGERSFPYLTTPFPISQPKNSALILRVRSLQK